MNHFSASNHWLYIISHVNHLLYVDDGDEYSYMYRLAAELRNVTCCAVRITSAAIQSMYANKILNGFLENKQFDLSKSYHSRIVIASVNTHGISKPTILEWLLALVFPVCITNNTACLLSIQKTICLLVFH